MTKLLPFLLLGAAGCGGEESNPPEPFDPEITELSIRPAAPIVAVGKRIQLVAEAKTADGLSYDQNATVEWSSADESLLTVSDIGMATGVGATLGVTVTATHPDGPVATVNVQVLSSDVVAVRVEPADATLIVGDSLQFTATAVLEDTTEENHTNEASWACNNLAAATIDGESDVTPERGLATGVEAGTATIGATFFGIRGTTHLTVVPE